MSLTGFNSDGTATINGLTTMSANIMNSDEMFYDSSTIPVNVKTAIDGITIDVTAAEADIVVLQGQMTTANSNISTLQGQFSTLNGEVNTLQSEMNTAQSDIIALYSTTAVSTAAIAGLVISQAAQDVTIAAHTVSIAALNGDVSTLQGQVSTLQVKTTDQSWGSLSGTTFSGRVNVGTTSAGVSLYTGAASEFGSGIITSSVEPLAITSNLAIGATQSTGVLNIGTLSTRSGGINMGTGASAKTITVGSAASTVAVNGTTTIAGITNINTTSLTNTNIGNGAAGGNFTVNAAVNTITGTTNTLTSTGDAAINCDQLLITTTTPTLVSIKHTSISTGDDFVGQNVPSDAYAMRLCGADSTKGLSFLGSNDNISYVKSFGTASTLQLLSDGDIQLEATDITLTSTGTSGGGINLTANTYINMTSTTGDITTNSSANIINQIGSVTKQTITAATVTTNPTTTIDNQINGTAKQTITSTLITNTIPSVNSGLTYPISTTTALGYHNSTTSTTKFTSAAANLASLSIPAAGCYLIEGQWYFGGTIYTAQVFTTISISTTSATVNTQRQQTAYQGGVAGNYAGQVTSIFNFTGASTVYLVGLAQNTLGATSTQTNFFSITRIA